MSTVKEIKSIIDAEIANGNLPVCLKYLEFDDNLDVSNFGYPAIYIREIEGHIDTYLRNYYKPISRPCLEPYISRNEDTDLL